MNHEILRYTSDIFNHFLRKENYEINITQIISFNDVKSREKNIIFSIYCQNDICLELTLSNIFINKKEIEMNEQDVHYLFVLVSSLNSMDIRHLKEIKNKLYSE